MSNPCRFADPRQLVLEETHADRHPVHTELHHQYRLVHHHRLGHLLVALCVQRDQHAQPVREPLYRPIRRFMPNLNGLDLSPLVVLVILFFLQQVIAQVAMNYG
jgi:hypothetical protein